MVGQGEVSASGAPTLRQGGGNAGETSVGDTAAMVTIEDGSATAPAPLAGWRVAVTAGRRREEQARLLRRAGAGVVFAGVADDLPASSGRFTGAVRELCLVEVLARRHVDAVTFTTTAAVWDLVARATDKHHGPEALAALTGDVV
ncbi:MAG: hypothetical protein KY438_11795, partial [Actinobacteria bacterium]|nr:hypothetical protein [Actinomycetota bacterium]